MTTPAGWFADPTRQHALRYWDGAAWTAHVSDPVDPSPDPPPGAPARGRSPVLAVAGLLLLCLAAVAVAVPAIAFVRDTDTPSITFDGRARDLTLEPDTTYGIFVDGAGDLSSSSPTCFLTDAAGRPVDLRFPPFTITDDDVTLDSVFDSGSGRVTASCAPGRRVVTRPFVSPVPLIAGSLAGGVAVVIGATLIGIWLATPSGRRQPGRLT